MNKPLSIETKQFYAELNSGIGGSSVPTIIGDPAALKYNSPHMMYQTYIGELERTEAEFKSPAWTGKFMEPTLLELLRLDTGYDVVPAVEKHVDPILGFETSMLRDDEFPFAVCHLDGWAFNDDVSFIVESKNFGEYRLKEYGKEYTDEVPEGVLYQCQHNLKVARSYCARNNLPIPERCLNPTLIGGNKPRIYIIDWHEELWSNLLPIEDEFWQRVVDKNPPPVDGSAATSEFIKLKYKAAEAKTTIELPDDMLNCVKHYINAVNLEKNTKNLKAQYENNLKDFMGNHELLTWRADPLFSWGNTKGKTSWKGVAEHLLIYIRDEFDLSESRIAEIRENIIAANVGEPGRQFRAKDKYLALIGEGDNDGE